MLISNKLTVGTCFMRTRYNSVAVYLVTVLLLNW